MSAIEQWGVVEIFGRRRHAGRISEVHRFGSTMLQVEVPQADDSFVTFLYGGSSIFGLRVVSEEEARTEAARQRGVWSAPQLHAAPVEDNTVSPEGSDADFEDVEQPYDDEVGDDGS